MAHLFTYRFCRISSWTDHFNSDSHLWSSWSEVVCEELHHLWRHWTIFSLGACRKQLDNWIVHWLRSWVCRATIHSIRHARETRDLYLEFLRTKDTRATRMPLFKTRNHFYNLFLGLNLLLESTKWLQHISGLLSRHWSQSTPSIERCGLYLSTARTVRTARPKLWRWRNWC